MDVVTWNKKDSTYYDRGRKAYGFGEEIPEKVLIAMGQETAEEFKAKGWLKLRPAVVEEVAKEVIETVQITTVPPPVDEPVETDEEKLKRLREEAIALELKPHHNAGAEKLQQMIDDHNKDNAES